MRAGLFSGILVNVVGRRVWLMSFGWWVSVVGPCAQCQALVSVIKCHQASCGICFIWLIWFGLVWLGHICHLTVFTFAFILQCRVTPSSEVLSVRFWFSLKDVCCDIEVSKSCRTCNSQRTQHIWNVTKINRRPRELHPILKPQANNAIPIPSTAAI